MKNFDREKTLLLAACAYLSLVTFSNLGSLRVLALGPLALDGGALLYPFTFTARDLMHKKCGAAATRFTIWLTAGANVLMFLFIWLVAALPPDLSVGAQTAYGAVLLPGLRLVAGSIIAMTVSELLDTAIYTRVRRRFGARRQWLRVLLSNLLSVPVDTALFLLIAFAGLFDAATLWALFVSNLALKYAVSLLSLGGVYLIKEDNA